MTRDGGGEALDRVLHRLLRALECQGPTPELMRPVCTNILCGCKMAQDATAILLGSKDICVCVPERLLTPKVTLDKSLNIGKLQFPQS